MADDPKVFAYLRRWNGQTLQVACNFSCEPSPLMGEAVTRDELLLGNYKDAGEAETLRPWEARITLA